MFTQLHCIALRTVRHSDSRNIVTAWTREAGLMAFAFPAGAGREARRRKAITSPLALFEGVSDIRAGKDIQSMRDVRPLPGSIAMCQDHLRNMQAMFISEVLDVLLRRTAPDDSLSDFLFATVEFLATPLRPAAVANFHILFLYTLAFHAGIAPDTDNMSPGYVFDMREGRFAATPPLHADYIMPAESAFLGVLNRLGFRTLHLLRLSREDRNRILDYILRYYAIHLAPLTGLRTLAVFREM